MPTLLPPVDRQHDASLHGAASLTQNLWRKVVAIALAIATVFAPACNDDEPAGPPESAILDEASLTYPGATETSRSFLEADDDRSVDGPSLANAARLTRRLSVGASAGAAGTTIRDWYRDRLTAEGWTSDFESEDSISMEKTQDGIRHRYQVNASGDAVTGYSIVYVMAFTSD